MKRSLKVAIIFSCFFPIAAIAHGAVYVGAGGGVSIVPDSDISYSSSVWGDDGKETLSFDTGYQINAVVGYGFAGLPIRIEGEILYQRNDIDSVSGQGYTESLQDSNFTNKGVLVNVYYDFRNNTRFTPFVSLGMGYYDLEITAEGEKLKSETTEWSMSKADGSGFAWQLSAGTAYRLTDNLSLDLKYRYYCTDGFTYTNQDTGAIDVYKSKFDYAVHTILLGIRYSF